MALPILVPQVFASSSCLMGNGNRNDNEVSTVPIGANSSLTAFKYSKYLYSQPRDAQSHFPSESQIKNKTFHSFY